MFGTQMKWQKAKALSENQYRLDVSGREQIGRYLYTKLNGINVINFFRFISVLALMVLVFFFDFDTFNGPKPSDKKK
jgi:uncharacterized membrane protein YfhO